MKLQSVLKDHQKSIIRETANSVGRSPKSRYQETDESENLNRISRLFEKVYLCIEKRDSSAILEYTQDLAKERFIGDFPLHEVLAAFNTLEAIVWQKITEYLEPVDYAESFRLVSTIFGFGKESLATEYVNLTAKGLPLASPLPDLRN